jgi:hypothetical protein
MRRLHTLWLFFVVALGCSLLGCGGTQTEGPTAVQPVESTRGPRAEFRGPTTIDAGEVDYARTREFVFPVGNPGGAPLTLKLVKRSCNCADVVLPAPIPPGAEGKVVINWAPIPGNKGTYTVSADLETNDPQKAKVELSIQATIKPLVHIFIDGKEENDIVDFGDGPILPNQPRTRELKLFSTELPQFALAPSCPLPGLKIETKPIKAGEQLGDYVARSGYTLELHASDQLPPGYVRTSLDLALSNLGDQPNRTINVPVYAVVGDSAFSVAPEGGFAFRKPRITDEDTAKVNLTLTTAVGEGGVVVESYEPKFLKVDAPVKQPSGKWLITAHMPKDDPEAAKYQPDAFMEGKVVLKVAGMQRPVTIRVKWDPDAH